MKIVIAGESFMFPGETAASKYVRLMARGLVEAGAAVHVMPLYRYWTGDTAAAEGWRGRCDNITWEYPHHRIRRPTSRLGLLCDKLRTDREVPRRLCALHAEGNMDVLLYYGGSATWLRRNSAICRQLGCPLVVQLVEWIASFSDRTAAEQRRARAFCDQIFTRADAAVVISRDLEQRARRVRGDAFPVHRMPILVDPAEWENTVAAPTEDPYVLYCANLDTYIEDACLVLEAMAVAGRDDLRLLLVGKASAATVAALRHRAAELGIEGRLELEEAFVSEERLRALYTGAAALLAPLHDNNRSRARFPFKVGEYLMAGRPVVSNRVGEVAAFLEDGKTAFLAEPGEAALLGRKIAAAVSGAGAPAVAKAGRNLALEHFDYRTEGRRLLEFLSTQEVR